MRTMASAPSGKADRELRLKKLKWRARTRGMKETNLLLGTYALANADKFSEAEMTQFEALLEVRAARPASPARLTVLQENDPDLHNWILCSREPPEQYNHDLMRKLQQHARNGLHNATLDTHIQSLS